MPAGYQGFLTIQRPRVPTTDNPATSESATYDLQRFHFHTPSEHTVAGQHAKMELHLVHKRRGPSTDANDFVAIGLMFYEGPRSSFLEKWRWVLPTIGPVVPTDHARPFSNARPTTITPAQNEAILDPMNELIRLINTQHFWHYLGSLTTPACTEAVEWFVMASPLTISTEQLTAFEGSLRRNQRDEDTTNNRPTVPRTTDTTVLPRNQQPLTAGPLSALGHISALGHVIIPIE
jgi:carbonic anhydrase